MRAASVLVLGTVLLGWPVHFLADDCLTAIHNGSSTGVNFVYPPGSGSAWTFLETGMGFWQANCGEQAPPLSRSTSSVSGALNLTVVHLVDGVPCDGNSNACGCADLTVGSMTNDLEGGTISVYNYNANGGFCGYMDDVFRHEIGHALGFGDVYGAACEGNVMHSSAGTSLASGQCNMLDNLWVIPDEDPCDSDLDPMGCDNGVDPPGSPIVLDLARDGFRFTSLDGGVEYDLDADGDAETLAWVGDPLDAFLFLDLNGNGRADDGRELFGNFTLLADGAEAAHGFEALAELDLREHGGNGDGLIDRGDFGYHLLELWLDLDLDGVTDAGETMALGDWPVEWISLKYRSNRRQDRSGNLLTYWSRVGVGQHEKVLPTWAVDVFFQRSTR